MDVRSYPLLAQEFTRSEVITLVAVLAILSLTLMIADDWWKRRLVRKARAKGRQVPAHWLQNRTDWRILVCLIAGFVLYLILLANSHLTNRDFGPLDPMMKWLFPGPNG